MSRWKPKIRDKSLNHPEPEVVVMYAEDLPAPKVNSAPDVLQSACHRISMVNVVWDAYERVAVLVCAECGSPVVGLKVEKRNKLALDLARPDVVMGDA